MNVLTRKLELFGRLNDDDKRLLSKTIVRRRTVDARSDIIHEGDTPDDVHLVLEGFACRYKVLPDGKRSIFAYLIPGDFCDLNVFILKEMDHTIASISPCVVVDIPRDQILELLSRPAIARSLWWATLVDEATLREWLVNLGQRDAETRIAHLLCELHLRLKVVGLTSDGSFTLPITQAELADTLGLSAVHVNRSLQSLRAQGLITLRSKVIEILDIHRMRTKSDFNPNYLHLDDGKPDHAAGDLQHM